NSDQTSAENSNSMKHESVKGQDIIAGSAELECEVSPSDPSPSPTKHHLVIFDDGTTQLVPAKRLKTDNFSSAENIILQSSKPKTLPEDSNELFLRSLLHDMSKLNPAKLRHFKTFVITKLTNLQNEGTFSIKTMKNAFDIIQKFSSNFGSVLLAFGLLFDPFKYHKILHLLGFRTNFFELIIILNTLCNCVVTTTHKKKEIMEMLLD
ncbi:hypothetical protein AVEN_3013-1, partial [Araneus ventricosus]